MTGSIETKKAKLVPFDIADLASIGNTHPLKPIVESAGLIMPVTPVIAESGAINYSTADISQINEGFNTYNSTTNRKLSFSNVIFPCDTLEGARYGLAALHFFRSYSLMDFGVNRTGRPPTPMYLSAFGEFIYNKLPCLMESYSVNLGATDMDLVPVPSPSVLTSSFEFNNNPSSSSRWSQDMAQLRQQIRSQNYSDVAWLPVKLEITFSLIVQHTPNYWKGFNMNDYRAGKMTEEW